MSVTLPQFANHEAYFSQIEKITHSHILRKAESLCKLLRYLANHSLTHPGVPLKEYQIATEVFGRPQNFDPQADSAVRVQAGRLRVKLLDYYAHEGLADPIVVEMPNGSYALNFYDREPPSPVEVPPLSRVAPVPFDRRRKIARGWIVAVVSLASALALSLAWLQPSPLRSARTARRSTMASPRTQPARFLASIRFRTRSSLGHLQQWRFRRTPRNRHALPDPAHDTGDLILDHYTGVGEVLAIHALDEVFGQLNHPIARQTWKPLLAR